MIQTEDRQILSALGRDDPEALGAAIERYSAYVATVAGNVLGRFSTPEDVEELTANVFVSLWKARGGLRTVHLRGWLAACARNEARTLLRKRKLSTVSQEDLILVSGDTAQRALEQKERRRWIRQTLKELGPPDSEIFLRYYYYEQPVRDIAEELGLKPEAVKTRLRRGREKLKTLLEKGGYRDGA